jgi:hypothetical protein
MYGHVTNGKKSTIFNITRAITVEFVQPFVPINRKMPGRSDRIGIHSTMLPHLGFVEKFFNPGR